MQVLGAGPYSMRIWLDPVKLKAYDLTVLDVQNAIKNQNIQVAAGQLGGPPVSADQVFQFTVNDPRPSLRRQAIRKHHRQVRAALDLDEPGGSDRTTSEINQTAAVVRIKDVAKVELSQEVYSTVSPGSPARRRRR